MLHSGTFSLIKESKVVNFQYKLEIAKVFSEFFFYSEVGHILKFDDLCVEPNKSFDLENRTYFAGP